MTDSDNGPKRRSCHGFMGFWVTPEGDVWVSRPENSYEEWLEDGEPWVHIDDGETGYRGPKWKMIMWAFYRGNYSGLWPEYVDDDQTNLSLDNLEFHFDDARFGPDRECRWRVNSVGLRVFDRRMLPRVKVVETGQVFETAAEAAFELQMHQQNISAVLNGRLDRAKGFTFRYI
jgi:hypothetical protein